MRRSAIALSMPSPICCWRSTTYMGGVAFVSEPYERQITPDTLARLDAFTEKLGIEWHISANSWWYPGWTIRILFYEPDETEGSTG